MAESPAAPPDALSGPAAALARLADGRDEAAWAWIAEHEGPAMYRVAARMLGAGAAEDACQEALLHVRGGARLFRAPATGDADAAARGWLLRVAANAAAMWARGEHRRAARERQVMAEAQVQTDQVSQPPPAVALDALRQALAELPEAQRLPLMLHYFGGQDYTTVAATVGTSPGAARVRVHRGLARLRERLTRVGVAIAGATLLEQLGAAEIAVPASAPARWATLSASSATPAVPATAIFGGLTIMTKIALACAALTVAGLVTFTAIPGAAEEHGEKHAEHPKETPKVVVKTEGHDAMPAGTKGATDGVILAKDHGKVILHTADGNLLFAPNWVGGAPKDGGGLDKEMLATLEKFKVGDKVHITWTWNERRRIETISAVK